MKIYKNKEWLHQKYIVEKQSANQIGALANTSADTIGSWLRRFDIPVRSRSEAFSVRCDPTTPWGQDIRKNLSVGHNDAYDVSTREGREYRAKLSRAHKERLDPTTAQGKLARKRHSESCKKAYDPNTVKGRQTRKRRSIALKRACDPSTVRGKELRRSRSNSCKRGWISGTYDLCNRFPGGIPKTTEMAMVSAFLENRMWDFVKQYRIPEDSHPYDFYIPHLNLLIECQGIYYHNEDNFPGVQSRDAKKRQYAIDHGYNFEAIAEEDITRFGAWYMYGKAITPTIRRFYEKKSAWDGYVQQNRNDPSVRCQFI